jgi:hypothetical protein
MTGPVASKAPDKASEDTKPAPSTSGGKVDTYRVCAPYVTLKSRSDTGGLVVLGYFEGAIVPESVDLDDLARHIRKGMVEKVEGAELKAVKAQQAEADKAEEAADVPDEEGVEAVKEAEATKAAADKAAEDEAAKAKKDRTPLIRASDSPRGTKTAQTG